MTRDGWDLVSMSAKGRISSGSNRLSTLYIERFVGDGKPCYQATLYDVRRTTMGSGLGGTVRRALDDLERTIGSEMASLHRALAILQGGRRKNTAGDA